jgi:tetratricopeptide (TPR) repeat protein
MNDLPDLSTNRYIHLVQAALDLRQGREFSQAAELLEQAIVLEPAYLPAYIYLGLVYQELEQFAEAEAIFRQALQREPECPEALQCLGMLCLKLERYPEAIANLEKHLKLDPDNETSLDVLAPLLLRTGRAQEAQAFLRAAWEKHNDPHDAVRYARFLISQEELAQACQFLNDAIQVSEDARLLVELALVLVIQGKYELAVQVLLKARDLRPDSDRVYRGLSHCYVRLEQADKALEYAERALAIDARHYRNWQAKADALLLLQRWDEASQAASTGIELINASSPDGQAEASPVLKVLFLQWFNALRRGGQVEAALAGLSQARRKFPQDGRFYLYPVILLLQCGQPLRALELVKPALEANLPGVVREEITARLMQAGIDLYQQGDTRSARAIIETLAVQMGGDPRLDTAAAFMLTGDGELDGAEELLQRAMGKSEPEWLGICLCDLGYIQLLRSQFEQAKETLCQVLQQPDLRAFLRIAFWINGRLEADYQPHPVRSASTHWVAAANLAALALAGNDRNTAQEYADQLLLDSQNRCTANLVQGCVAFAAGQASAARQAWEVALSCTEAQGETELLNGWLSLLPGE